MAVRFKINPNLNAELGNDPHVQQVLVAVGFRVKGGIRGNLPAGAGGGKRAKPFADRSYATLKGTGDTVRVEVGTRWRLAHLLEFGSRNNPAYAPLRRSAMQTGFRLEVHGK